MKKIKQKNHGFFTKYINPDGFTGVLYLKNEKGKDYYDLIDELDKKSLKIQCEGSSIDRFDYDASKLSPYGRLFIEVFGLENFNPDNFYIDNGILKERTAEEKQKVELLRSRNSLIADANRELSLLIGKATLGIADETDKKRARELQEKIAELENE